LSEPRRLIVVAAAVLLAVAALITVGRWEEHRAARHEIAGMRVVLAAIGDLMTRRPTGYRVGPPDCLAYATKGNAFGLQVCFDSTGRVVETVDRRGVQPKYSSLVYQPSLSTIRVPRTVVDQLLKLGPGKTADPAG
jgi:hypothetical protein